MVQVAKRGASVLKRRKSKNKMDQPALNTAQQNVSSSGAVTSNLSESTQTNISQTNRSESEDVVFYTEEPRAGNKFINLGDYFFIQVLENLKLNSSKIGIFLQKKK